jgi:hypothetical protein
MIRLLQRGRVIMSSIVSSFSETSDRRAAIRTGMIGGLIGGVVIWIYEAIVWVGVQHLLPLAGIPRNATGLVFGKGVQESLGAAAYVLGTGIHFFFCLVWGALFALIWPSLHRRGYEATLAAMFYAIRSARRAPVSARRARKHRSQRIRWHRVQRRGAGTNGSRAIAEQISARMVEGIETRLRDGGLRECRLG